MNISRCRIIAVGKVRKRWVQDGVEVFLKRLPGLVITELRDSTRDKEAEAIRQALRPDELPVLLMEQGKSLSSIDFAARLEAFGSERLAFVIGGADGLAEDVRRRADLVLAFGRATWPHLLVRGMLAEQLYRAQQILAGHPYHRA